MGTKYRGTAEETRALNAYIKLMRAANSLRVRLERRLLKRGLTENQFGTLETLLHLGPLNPRTLRDKLLTTGGNVTVILDNLERRSLVRRVRDRTDRRQVTIHLTAEGRRLAQSVFARHLPAIVEELAVLTGPEKEQLGELCKRIGLGTRELRPGSRVARRTP
jgi:MarR family transcriptional regulator, 2-MHQ and catechol-resistance regulon repressor